MFIYNNTSDNHFQKISQLIKESDECILCSCWIDETGFNLIDSCIREQTPSEKISVFSNRENKHVSKGIKDKLKSNPQIDYFISKRGKRLHSKIYYFSFEDNTYKAIIGSANLTRRGLCENDEFSVILSGDKSSQEHAKLKKHLDRIKNTLEPNK